MMYVLSALVVFLIRTELQALGGLRQHILSLGDHILKQTHVGQGYSVALGVFVLGLRETGVDLLLRTLGSALESDGRLDG